MAARKKITPPLLHDRVDIRIDDPVWNKSMQKIRPALSRLKADTQQSVIMALQYQNKLRLKTVSREIQLILTNNRQIKKLNKAHRGKDYATNVLSFPLYDPAMDITGFPAHIGDIVIAHDIVAEEAVREEKSFRDHFIHLVVHGVLHLCGYDHETPGQARTMERLEKEILLALNIPDPYKPRK